MPFKKQGDHYVSTSGRKYTKKQLKLYYATGGFKRGYKVKKRVGP